MVQNSSPIMCSQSQSNVIKNFLLQNQKICCDMVTGDWSPATFQLCRIITWPVDLLWIKRFDQRPLGLDVIFIILKNQINILFSIQSYIRIQFVKIGPQIRNLFHNKFLLLVAVGVIVTISYIFVFCTNNLIKNPSFIEIVSKIKKLTYAKNIFMYKNSFLSLYNMVLVRKYFEF